MGWWCSSYLNNYSSCSRYPWFHVCRWNKLVWFCFWTGYEVTMNLARSRIMRVVVNQPNAHVTTFVLQPDVTGGNDNLLVDGAPNDQNGSLDLIQFGGSTISGTYRSLIKFDLSAIPS